jgi:hypothetical protein
MKIVHFISKDYDIINMENKNMLRNLIKLILEMNQQIVKLKAFENTKKFSDLV